MTQSTRPLLFHKVSTQLLLTILLLLSWPHPTAPQSDRRVSLQTGVYPGDLLLGALYPLHYANLSAGPWDRCGRLNPLEGVQAVEATLFTLERLRQSGLLAGNLSIGALVVDTCQDVDVALNQSLNFTNALAAGALRRGLIRCPAGGQPAFVANAGSSVGGTDGVIGLLGAAESDVTVAIAGFMKHFRVPQISYLSTSPILSSKEKFPYFLRTVPSDSNTVRSIVDLLRQQNWTYVHVVYDDTNYGTMAFNVFEHLIAAETSTARHSRICISTKIKIDSSDWEPADYKRAVHENLLAPSNANVVLVLLSQPTLAAFFDALVACRRSGDSAEAAASSTAESEVTNASPQATKAAVVQAEETEADWRRRVQKLDRLAWIGTDTWSMRRRRRREELSFLSRSIVLLPRTAHIPGFAEHMRRLRPSRRPENPWLREWFEEECGCTYASGGGDGPDCLNIEEDCRRRVLADFTELSSLHFVSDAVLAFAHAVKSIQSSLWPKPLAAQLLTGDLLMTHLRNVSFTKCTGEPFKFHNGVDGPPEYSLQYYNESKEQWVTDGNYIGTRNYTERLLVGENLAEVIASFPESRCANDCEKDEAKQFPTSSCCWICIKCGRYDIVETPQSDSRRQHRSLSMMSTPTSTSAAGRQVCRTCLNGSQPDATRRACLQLPLVWSGYSHPHTIPVAVISALGLVTTAAFGLVFLCKRDTPLIKASGRETSAVLLAGIFLSYLCPYLMLLKPHLLVCAVTRLAPGLCFTICYAAILAKTNRIARIFQVSAGTTKRTKFTSPISQLYIIGSMVVAELLILAVGLVVDTPRAVERETHESRTLECSGVRAAHLSTGISFPIVLLLLATLYAFKIRKVPDGFNESRMLAFVNYANCTVVIILIPVMFVLDREVQTGVVICYGMQLSATAVLLGIFLPRIYIVLARPEKNTKEAIMCRARSQGVINNAKYSQVEIRNSVSSIAHDAASTVEPTPATPEAVRCLDDDDYKSDRGGGNSTASSSRHLSGGRLVRRENSDPGGSGVVGRRRQAVQSCDCRVHRNVTFTDAGTSMSVQLQQSPLPWSSVRDSVDEEQHGLPGESSAGSPTSPKSPRSPQRKQWDQAQFTTTV